MQHNAIPKSLNQTCTSVFCWSFMLLNKPPKKYKKVFTTEVCNILNKMKNVKYMYCALGSVMVKDTFWYCGINFDNLKQEKWDFTFPFMYQNQTLTFKFQNNKIKLYITKSCST